jgi:ABC-type lipoprotein release transport system permease subunit
VALAFGFCIVTTVTSLKDAMSENLYLNAQGHYAGDIVVAGYDHATQHGHHLDLKTMDAILAAAEEAGIDPRSTVMRTHFGDKGVLYFKGNTVRLKYTTGVDWDNEADYLNSLVSSDGAKGADSGGIRSAGEDTIILSAPVAQRLGGVRVGDRVILEVETKWGQKNTGEFVVGGIFDDSSIFGYYKAYVARSTLNELLLHEREECSHIGFFLKDRAEIETMESRLWDILSQSIPLAPLVRDRAGLDRELDMAWQGIRSFVITIPVYLSEVSQMLDALNLLTYFLYTMMLLIILMSAGVTYRLILHERMKDIGTMRAIGFHEADVRRILLIETVFLGTISLAVGFCLSMILTWIVSRMSFSWFPSFEIFMNNGSLRALYRSETMGLNTVAVYAIVIAAFISPTFHSSRAPLAGMLAGSIKE